MSSLNTLKTCYNNKTQNNTGGLTVNRFIVTLGLFLLSAGTAFSTDIKTMEDLLKEAPHLRKLIETGEGHAELLEVRDMSSLYELVISTFEGRKVAYLTKDLKFLILGSIFDKEGNNLTRVRIAELNRINIEKLPLNSALKHEQGNGTKRLVVFLDPYCPYSRALLKYLENKKNYILYVFFYPLSDRSLMIIKSSICEEKSIFDVIKLFESKSSKESLTPETNAISECEKAEKILEEHLILAQSLRVRGVPFIIFEDGSNFYGFDSNILNRYLD